VHAALEGEFELVVGNAWHIRNVPGRKTDLKDAEWIAEPVSHGLIEGARSAEAMADLTHRRLRRKRDPLIPAREAKAELHQRFLLAMQLRRLESIERDIDALDQYLTEKIEILVTETVRLGEEERVDSGFRL